MSKERMKILELLEKGAITADEAAMLMEQVGASEARGFGFSEETREQMEEKLRRFTARSQELLKEIGVKISDGYKTAEPKIKQASYIVLEKAAKVADELAKTLNASFENAKARQTEKCDDEKGVCAAPVKEDDEDKPRPN